LEQEPLVADAGVPVGDLAHGVLIRPIAFFHDDLESLERLDLPDEMLGVSVRLAARSIIASP
jgi:hypothetical protein